MTDEQFTIIKTELAWIRTEILKLTETRTPIQRMDALLAGEIPMPTEIIADPGAVEVHFGKNKGMRLDQLAAKSAEWYAKDPEMRLDKAGKPFPPRPEDVRLRNAARCLYHQRTGKLKADLELKPNPAPGADVSVPF
jgi:hypothetical protein